jgi:hypothetical protein
VEAIHTLGSGDGQGFPIGGFQDKASIANHIVISLGRLTWGGQVVANKDGIGGVEPQGLELSQLYFPPPGNANLLTGEEQTK